MEGALLAKVGRLDHDNGGEEGPTGAVPAFVVGVDATDVGLVIGSDF